MRVHNFLSSSVYQMLAASLNLVDSLTHSSDSDPSTIQEVKDFAILTQFRRSPPLYHRRFELQKCTSKI